MNSPWGHRWGPSPGGFRPRRRPTLGRRIATSGHGYGGDPARSRAAHRARARGEAGYRSRVEGENQTEGLEPRSEFPDASVDPTEARKATVRRFGRSDRSAPREGRLKNGLGPSGGSEKLSFMIARFATTLPWSCRSTSLSLMIGYTANSKYLFHANPFSSRLRTTISAAGAAEKPMAHEKPTCGPGLLQRLVRPLSAHAGAAQSTAGLGPCTGGSDPRTPPPAPPPPEPPAAA